MTTRQLEAWVSRIEKRIHLKQDDGTFTLEKLCRSMWRSNPAHCRELSEESGEWIFRSCIPRFETEDAKRNGEVKRE
jgi:hypothetical protein